MFYKTIFQKSNLKVFKKMKFSNILKLALHIKKVFKGF